MPIPTWTPGQILTASDVNTWLVVQAVIKPSDEAVTSSTTIQDDNDLVLPVAASATYDFRCLVVYTAASGGDIKWTWTGPAGATLLYQCVHNEGGATGVTNSGVVDIISFTGFSAGAGATTNMGLMMEGSLTTSGTAGNLTFRWAQQTSSGTATTVRTGSKLVLQRTG